MRGYPNIHSRNLHFTMVSVWIVHKPESSTVIILKSIINANYWNGFSNHGVQKDTQESIINASYWNGYHYDFPWKPISSTIII